MCLVFVCETSTIVVLPNCCDSKNPALLVCVLEITLRLFSWPLLSQDLHCHPLLAHSGVAPLISLSPRHPNTDKKLRDMTASLWELGQRFAQGGICTTAHEGLSF